MSHLISDLCASTADACALASDLDTISDRVMSSGLGLKQKIDGSPSPSLKSAPLSPEMNGRSLHPPSPARPSTARPSSSGSDLATETFAEKLERRRATLASNRSSTAPAEPLQSARDIHVLFANIEDIVSVAEALSGVLDGARGSETDDAADDRIGEAFSEMVSPDDLSVSNPTEKQCPTGTTPADRLLHLLLPSRPRNPSSARARAGAGLQILPRRL